MDIESALFTATLFFSAITIIVGVIIAFTVVKRKNDRIKFLAHEARMIKEAAEAERLRKKKEAEAILKAELEKIERDIHTSPNN